MGDTTTEVDARSGAELIAAERRRQVESEGWTDEHDDRHEASQLAKAAAGYVLAGSHEFDRKWMQCRGVAGNTGDRGDRFVWVPLWWPWDADDWKPSGDRIRDLVKAGALIAAEIDRLKRLGGGSDVQ